MCKAGLSREQIFPNFALEKVLKKSEVLEVGEGKLLAKYIMKTLGKSSEWSLADFQQLRQVLEAKEKDLLWNSEQTSMELLDQFLDKVKAVKESRIATLQSELAMVKEDMALADRLKNKYQTATSVVRDSDREGRPAAATSGSQEKSEERCSIPVPANGGDSEDVDERSSKRFKASRSSAVDPAVPTGNSEEAATLRTSHRNMLASRRQRIDNHFDELERVYFAQRAQKLICGAEPLEALDMFRYNLSTFTNFSTFRTLTTMKNADLHNNNPIISSIEFDADEEFFATSGVSKKIKIFDYASVLTDVNFPIMKMDSSSKISCLSWNSYIKGQIASSDYEGIVTIWDAHLGKEIYRFDEHDKRVWSVDFSPTDPTRLASGSDDTKVKIWSTSFGRSVMTIPSQANVCSVEFSPVSSYHVAFGSADHHVHYYDLRNTRKPLNLFKGHSKAVSYVKFLEPNKLISASTDSTLRMWDTDSLEFVRCFEGHLNEKNFVGLTCNDDYIACGSENNSIFCYHKEFTKPIVGHKFGTVNAITGEETHEETGQFVSSVCWRKRSNVLLAANSQGTIKVLQLE
eukprot:Clim_evm60s148 gene=Clim_evmTU60s148